MSLKYRLSGKRDDDQNAKSRFCEIKNFGISMTVQSPTEEVDINKIMARIRKGQTVLTSQGTPFFGDVSDLGGLQDAIIKVQEADDLFMQYPADLREKFNNDPVELVNFLSDSRNLDEARKLGLVNPLPAPEPEKTPAPAVPPVAG